MIYRYGCRLSGWIAMLLLCSLYDSYGGETNYAGGEFFIKGTVSGTYADTHVSDDGYQSITEDRRGNLTFLEHKWTFNVTGGDSVSFHVEAYKTDAGDGENFIFSYSTDGSFYTDMLTVTNESDSGTLLTYALPADTRGVVFVRVVDSDQVTKNLKDEDAVHIDYMAMISTGEPLPPVDNLLINPGFEEGTAYWYGYDGVTLESSMAEIHGGTNALYVSNRTYNWQGPIHDLLNTMARDHSYSNSIWVKPANISQADFTLTIKSTVDSVDTYHHIDTRTATNSGWTQLSGFYTNEYDGELTGLTLYIEGPAAGVNYYVDDGVVQGSGDWEAEADRRIEQIRKRDVELYFVNAYGEPLTNVDVVIQQTRHHFGFGAALSDWVLNEPKYAAYFTNHFEWAVFENETKWSEIEPYKDAASYATADAMYNFCISNNIRMRGHCIYWSVRQYIQEWVQDLAVTPDTLRHYMSNHLDNTVFRYREHFEHWDVNNEMLHGNFYSNIYGASIRPWMFERAHAVDPDAQLFVNDYGVLSYSDTATYVQQISGLMADGAPIHGIGAQCHMWELNPYLLLSRLDTLGELDLPVWCTEFDISQADETDRARQLEIFYRAAFSHPAVEGILMWGFWASNHWRGADAALVDADWSTNAAGEKYEALMESWTTETTLTANASGRIAFRGFHGSYILMASTNGGGSSFSLPLELPPAERACCRVIMLPHQDADHDGMPDAWEQVHGLNTGQNDAVADPDGDGVGNLNEYWAATIPTDCLSLPKLDMHTVNVQTNYLSYLADDTRFYQVEYRTNLISGSWLALSDVRRGSGGPVTLTNRQPAVRGYYRLRIQNGID